MISNETQKLIDEVVKDWDAIKASSIVSNDKPYPHNETKAKIGSTIWWENPNLIWVFTTDKEEDYEGSQEQIGIARDGSIRWEYQSHCSCNGYEESHDHGEDFLKELVDKKSFRLNDIPEDWETKVQENIKKILT